MAAAAQPSEFDKPGTWERWYEFARHELGYGHQEAVDYANHRYVEDANRAARTDR